MAYETLTYENLLDRMMERVTSNYPNLDTRESSVIRNTLSAEAMELATAYSQLENLRDETFILTASREGKIRRCQELGVDITIFNSTYGTFKGVFNVEVPIGSRWNLDLYNYVVVSYIGKNADNQYEYTLQCETLGTSPNGVFGTLTPILDTPTGLTYAELTDILIEGENETSDEGIQNYYMNKVNGAVTDGNVKQYEQWCEAYTGVGAYKVFPLWNGANTVKVSILSASNEIASAELIASFQNYLDPNTTGMGDGIAPIGAFVTVSTATEKPVTVSANVMLNAGYSDSSTVLIDSAIREYFANIAYVKAQLSYIALGAVILACPAVEFISDLKVNESNLDINIDGEEIVTLGTTTWTVM